MIVYVDAVSIPAMSTIGYGEGYAEDGRRIRFAGDHRPMRHLGEVIADGPVAVEIEDWQILALVEVSA